jgi:hypothetical protein
MPPSYGRKNKNNNVKNEESQLFKSLTRLFSGPLVNFRQQSQLRFRRKQLDKFKFNSASGKQFQKTSYNPFDAIQSNIMANQTRAERYSDFDSMEFTPEIASALDIYADEMTTHSALSKMLTIKSPNQEIRGILDSLFYDVLNIEFNLFGWCRTMCKFGDMFLYLDIDPELGVKSVLGLPTPEIERLEGEDKTNPNYVQFQWNTGGLTFESWQIAHFRILGQDKYAPYGTSVLESSRRIWRQLNLLEDAMMAYRIVRAPDRRVFYLDVGNIAPEDVEQFMVKAQAQMKRNMIVDQNTGRVDLRYNPMSIDEDYFIPIRGQSNTKIDTLQGGSFVGDIEDVEYLRDKLFSALKIPASYLSRAKGGDEDKATLAQKDVRFARTIQRLQRALVAVLENIGIIHLFTLGYRNEDLLNFSLSLNNPSKISELQELEHWKTKFEVAAQAKEGFFSKRWIAENIFNLSEQDFKKIQREIFHDKQFEAAVAAIAAGGSPPEEGGLGGGGGGALPDLGGGSEMPELPAGPEAGAPPPEGGEVTGPVVPPGEGGGAGAAPAKRDDRRKRDNGYTKKPADMRTSSMKYEMSKMGTPEAALGVTRRTLIPGDLAELVKMEGRVPRDDNEVKLFESNSEMKMLLETLEKKNGKQDRETEI